MRQSKFRSTTALLMTLALSAGQIQAQGFGAAPGLDAGLKALVGSPDAPRVGGALQICALGDPVPCVLTDGRIARKGDEQAAAEAAANPDAAAVAEALARADAEAMAAKPQPATPEPAPEPAPQPAEPAPKPAPQPAPDQPAPPTAAPEPAPQPAPEAQPVPQPDAQPRPAPQPDAQPEPAPQPDAQPQPAPQPDAQPEPAPPAAGDTGTSAPPADAQEPAPQQPMPEQPAQRPAPKPDRQPDAEKPAADAAPGETTEARDDFGLTEEQAQAEAAAQEAAQAQDAAAAVDAAGNAQPDAGEVVSETISEDDVRASDEDFAKGDGAEAAPKKKDGLSDFEKIAILGLGALAVGAILKNGDKVVSTSGDRVVAERPDGSVYILKNDDEILRQPGAKVETRRFDDGSTLTTVKRADGTEVRTIRDANGRVLRRTKVLVDGTSVTLFDDTEDVAAVDVSTLPKARADEVELSGGDLDAALRRKLDAGVDRRFSLGQIRNIRAVRELVPIIDLDTITFDTGSAAISANEAEELVNLGRAMESLLAENPGEVFLIEGHTDAVGSATSNLTLSDRRAESLAKALTEYFDIPPENLVVQGYGESYLKVPTLAAERANRRVAVRRITPLLTASN